METTTVTKHGCIDCGLPVSLTRFRCDDCRKDLPAARLEYLRGELRAERISYGELHELQGLTAYINPDDVFLLEAAGVPEFGEERDSQARDYAATRETINETCGSCNADIGQSSTYPWHGEDEDCRAVRQPETPARTESDRDEILSTLSNLVDEFGYGDIRAMLDTLERNPEFPSENETSN